MLKLYNYFRSSASYRVRIALHLKGLAFEYVPVHLVNNGGEQFKADYKNLNPMAQVPTLIHDGQALSQSVAIIDYLDCLKFSPRLFPAEPYLRARILQFCEIFNSGIQPLQNLNVTNYLDKTIGISESKRNEWVVHFISLGLAGAEAMVAKTAGSFCFGGEVTAAECFLIPQLFASRRFNVPLEKYPNLMRIEANCLELEPFKKAHPMAQIDSPKS